MLLRRLIGVLNDRPIYKNDENSEFLFYLQVICRMTMLV